MPAIAPAPTLPRADHRTDARTDVRADARTDPPSESDVERRLTLGRFLRARRERLAPALAGVPSAGVPGARRRRTPGLRREEVAERAGVSAAWYTWLEQGRDVRSSPATVGRLADALQLAAADRAYLRTLALGAEADGAAPAPVVSPALQGVLDAFTALPAYVADARWDVVAWNAAAQRVLHDFEAIAPAERNLVRLVLLDPAMRAQLPDWEDEAQSAVALFRASTAGFVGELWHRALVDELTRESPAFARWWPALELRATHRTRKVVVHPTAGRLVLTPTTLHVADAPDLRVLVYQPATGPEGDDTRARLAHLLAAPRHAG